MHVYMILFPDIFQMSVATCACMTTLIDAIVVFVYFCVFNHLCMHMELGPICKLESLSVSLLTLPFPHLAPTQQEKSNSNK